LFKLPDEFVQQYMHRNPNWGAAGQFTYYRTYSRKLSNGQEAWYQTVRRVVEGCYQAQLEHCGMLKLPWSWTKALTSAKVMYDLIYNFKFLPPGRGLWMMGTDYVKERGGACLNNCGFVSTKDLSTDFSEPFLFMMDMMMLGVGVGSDTRGAGRVRLRTPKESNTPFKVGDTREGWVELIKAVLDSFVGKGLFPSIRDYSGVRPFGALIKGFGGTASGPEPLEHLVQDIYSILNPTEGTMIPITSTQIVDVFNAIGKCVVAGNVRRSAEIMFGDACDEDFLALKTNFDCDPYPAPEYVKDLPPSSNKNKYGVQSWRWASNNSIFAHVGMDYSSVIDQLRYSGEPGLFWLENARAYSRMKDAPDYVDSAVDGCNPCGEQSLESFELCCLVETMPSLHNTLQEFLKTLKYAYLYAKSVTLIPTHWARTNAVLLRNRRIGTSQTGIAAAIQKLGVNKYIQWCDKGYTYLRSMDKKYSDWLCIPRSKKITSVKPSGTVSLLPGVPPGIHFPWSEYYIRRIRVSKDSPYIKLMQKAGYPVEEDIFGEQMVISFPVRESNFRRSKFDISVWEQFKLAALLQRYWSDNQVSITITFRPEEYEDLGHALSYFETELKSLSFLPLTDHKYKQAPYETITKSEYEKLVSKVSPVDYRPATHELTDKFCDAGEKCLIE